MRQYFQNKIWIDNIVIYQLKKKIIICLNMVHSDNTQRDNILFYILHICMYTIKYIYSNLTHRSDDTLITMVKIFSGNSAIVVSLLLCHLFSLFLNLTIVILSIIAAIFILFL